MHVGSRLILPALNEIYGYVLKIPIPVRCRTVDSGLRRLRVTRTPAEQARHRLRTSGG